MSHRLTELPRRILAIVFLCAGLAMAAGQASAQIMPGQGKGWLTIASRTAPNDAITLARSYAARFPTAAVPPATDISPSRLAGWTRRTALRC